MGSPCDEALLDALMARLADGDRSAHDPLFRELYPRALRLARARLEPSIAADAVQSALLNVFARASEFTPGRPVLPWFYAIVANEIRAHARRAASKRARTVGAEAAELIPSTDDPERATMEHEMRRALALAIESLDGASADAIHAMMSDSPRPALADAVFRKRVSRAYARLRALLLGGVHGK